jgi:hypothetical protein
MKMFSLDQLKTSKTPILQTEESSKFIDKRRTNVKSDLIEITEDKLENILLKHLHKIGIRKSWIIPLSIFVNVLLTQLSASFGDKFGVSGTVWEAIFVLITLSTGVWFVISIIRIISNWKEISISALIAIIKNAKEE